MHDTNPLMLKYNKKYLFGLLEFDYVVLDTLNTGPARKFKHLITVKKDFLV